MENIKYPLIGIIAVASDHESNYIFTEEEFQNVHFEKARKIILQDENKLTKFIKGEYNNLSAAKTNPNWFWNVSGYPRALNGIVELFYTDRMCTDKEEEERA